MAVHINNAFDVICYVYFAINIQIYSNLCSFLEYNIQIRFFGPVDSPSSHAHTYPRSHMLTQTHAHAHTCSHKHTLTHTHTHTHTRSHMLTQTYTHICTLSQALTCSQTHRLTSTNIQSLNPATRGTVLQHCYTVCLCNLSDTMIKCSFGKILAWRYPLISFSLRMSHRFHVTVCLVQSK